MSMIRYYTLHSRLATRFMVMLNGDVDIAMVEAWAAIFPDRPFDPDNRAHIIMRKDALEDARRWLILGAVRRLAQKRGAG